MILEIRSGAPARPAPEAEDADPTHGSSDFQLFLQSEIGGLRGTSRLVHKTSACPRIHYNFPGFAQPPASQKAALLHLWGQAGERPQSTTQPFLCLRSQAGIDEATSEVRHHLRRAVGPITGKVIASELRFPPVCRQRGIRHTPVLYTRADADLLREEPRRCGTGWLKQYMPQSREGTLRFRQQLADRFLILGVARALEPFEGPILVGPAGPAHPALPQHFFSQARIAHQARSG